MCPVCLISRWLVRLPSWSLCIIIHLTHLSSSRERGTEMDTTKGGGQIHHLLGPTSISTFASFSVPYPQSWHPYPPESRGPWEASRGPWEVRSAQSLPTGQRPRLFAGSKRDSQGHFIHCPVPGQQWDKSNGNRWESSLREGDLRFLTQIKHV